MSNRIAVLIPCYNERQTIEKVVKDYKKALPEADIYVYDNNSTDGTNKIARRAGAIVRYETKQGKGNVMRAMFRDIEADCYLMVDGDDTYSAEDARKMCEYVLKDNVDMVIGDRLSGTYFKEKTRKFHKSGNRIVRWTINTIFRRKINDIMTGYRALSYQFVKSYPVLAKGFELETEMTIHAIDKNFTLKEIPIKYKERAAGSISKLNTYSDGVKVIKTIATLFKEYKPGVFFNIISLFIFVIAAILAIPVFIEYMQTGLVPRFPTLIVSCILLVICLLLSITSIILQVIVKKNKQLFEILLNQINIMKKQSID